MRKRNCINKIILSSLIWAMSVAVPHVVMAQYTYEHDPRLNYLAMEDIQYDENAVYGFVPRKDSERLADFASIDFSDPETVAECQEARREYHEDFEKMFDVWDEMRDDGKTSEEIAKVVSPMRNEIRLSSYDNDPEGLERVKASNLKTYGNENGPTPEQLYDQYGSWDTVILKSFSANSGMDACLGLYDEEYDHNVLTGAVDESDTAVYTVEKGDYLAKIATVYFGDALRWKDIYDANNKLIKNANVIYQGMQLQIPID